jgi:hypothetical protein
MCGVRLHANLLLLHMCGVRVHANLLLLHMFGVRVHASLLLLHMFGFRVHNVSFQKLYYSPGFPSGIQLEYYF